MSDLIDGMGTAVEGGLLARALEPDSGALAADPHQPEACLNCATPLTGAYCQACGQRGNVHRTIGAFLHDLLHGALHFEGKLWRTLPMLAFKPGALTRRYVEGQRARFVSPMALFLFSVFLMFAVFQAVGISAPTQFDAPEMRTTMEDLREQADAEVTEQRAAIEALAPDDPQRRALEDQLIEAEATAEGLDQIEVFNPADASSWSVTATGNDFIDEQLIAKWNENPGLMLYKLQANSYKFSWLLIPISIPFVWLLFFWKRRFKGYDHAIFVTYSLSFMTLLFVTLSVLGAIGVSAAALLLIVALVPPIHLYKQLRGAYELSRFSAFWRLMALSVFIWVVIALFFEVLLVLGAL